MRKLERLQRDLDETKRRLDRCEEECRVIAKQRDEFEKNASDYQAALTSVVESIGVIGDGAVSRLSAAQSRAYERMSDRILTQTPDTEKR